jgi:hypothetical protein
MRNKLPTFGLNLVQIYQRQNVSNTNMRNKKYKHTTQIQKINRKVVIRRAQSGDTSCPLTGPK